jgi:hypothetical protein
MDLSRKVKVIKSEKEFIKTIRAAKKEKSSKIMAEFKTKVEKEIKNGRRN